MALEDIVIGDRQTSISPILAKHLFETSLDLIMITDRHGQFIEISPSSMTILGYRPDEMTGRNGIRFIYPDDLDRTRNEMRPSASRRADAELRDPLHAQGSIVSLAWSGVWSESDQLHFFIGRDVTAAKLIERLKTEPRAAHPTHLDRCRARPSERQCGRNIARARDAPAQNCAREQPEAGSARQPFVIFNVRC
jgi:PAS domain S-box-containing protein